MPRAFAPREKIKHVYVYVYTYWCGKNAQALYSPCFTYMPREPGEIMCIHARACRCRREYNARVCTALGGLFRFSARGRERERKVCAPARERIPRVFANSEISMLARALKCSVVGKRIFFYRGFFVWLDDCKRSLRVVVKVCLGRGEGELLMTLCGKSSVVCV